MKNFPQLTKMLKEDTSDNLKAMIIEAGKTIKDANVEIRSKAAVLISHAGAELAMRGDFSVINFLAKKIKEREGN